MVSNLFLPLTIQDYTKDYALNGNHTMYNVYNLLFKYVLYLLIIPVSEKY